MKVTSESKVAQSVRLLAGPWTEAYQAPLSMVFSRQEYRSGVPLPSLSHHLGSWQVYGETVETVADFIFGGLQNHCRLCAALKLIDACSLEEKL